MTRERHFGQTTFASLAPSFGLENQSDLDRFFDRCQPLLKLVLHYGLQQDRPRGSGLFVDLTAASVPRCFQHEETIRTASCLPELVFNPRCLDLIPSGAPTKSAMTVLVTTAPFSLSDPHLLEYLGRTKKDGGGFFIAELFTCRPPANLDLATPLAWLKTLGLAKAAVSLRQLSSESFPWALIFRARRPLKADHPPRSIIGTKAEYLLWKNLNRTLAELTQAGWQTVDAAEFRQRLSASSNLPRDARLLGDGAGRLVEHTCGCLFHLGLNGLTTQLYHCNHDSAGCGHEPELPGSPPLPLFIFWRHRSAAAIDKLHAHLRACSWSWGFENIPWRCLGGRTVIQPDSTYWGDQIDWEGLLPGDTVKTACGCGGLVITARQPHFDSFGRGSATLAKIIVLLRVASHCLHHQY